MPCVILTGSPGVGKTTIIKRLCEDLKAKSVEFAGFYTEEVRDEQYKRIGFDIRTFDGKHGILARHDNAKSLKSNNRIGQYNVYIQDFEKIITPIFESSNNKLIIIDEVGSMELLSNVFQKYMSTLISDIDLGKCSVIATVPLINRRNSAIIENLKSSKNGVLFTLTKSNRNSFYNSFVESCLEIKKTF